MGVCPMAVSEKWASPTRLHPLTFHKSRLISSSPAFSLREVYIKLGLLSHHTLDGGKLPNGTTLKAKASSFREVQSVGRISGRSVTIMVDLDDYPSRNPLDMDKRSPKMDDSCVGCANLAVNATTELSLLMENIDKIEDLTAGADLVRLERDILTHIRRLGALKLFRTCLSRAPMENAVVDSNFVEQENLSDKSRASILVRSGKKEQRKLRRDRASEKLFKKYAPQIHTKSRHKVKTSSFQSSGLRKNINLFGLKPKREVIARNESEMSMRVKEIAFLEKIHKDLEEEIGRPPTFMRWAEAAGLDQNTLQHRLQVGWYCRDKLLKSTRSLVMFIAKNYRGMGIAFDDLLQAGYVGVLNGAERFDIEKGYRFSTYVQYWIRKSILSMILRHSRVIHVPVRMENMISRIHKARRAFYTKEGKHPQDEEIAELTGLSLANVRLANKCSRPVGSIEQEIRDGWCTRVMEVTADTSVCSPHEVIAKQHRREDVLNLLQALHPRERLVLLLRYGLDDGRCNSLEEIGRLCRVTKEWIRKIEGEALSKLRKEDVQKNLSAYLQ